MAIQYTDLICCQLAIQNADFHSRALCIVRLFQNWSESGIYMNMHENPIQQFDNYNETEKRLTQNHQ